MALARPPPLEELSKELLSVDEEGCAEDKDEAVLRAPAAFREDSCPQAILKL